jgi:multiple sugar transport system substrate-binding protein
MRNLFLITLTLLIAFSQLMVFLNKGGTASGVPVIYWATDQNPTRETTVKLYRAWLKKNGYPDMDVRVDPVNGQAQKLIIQGLSGVAPDMFNIFGWDLQYLNQLGIIANLDPIISNLPIPSENHDPVVSNELFIDGKRMAFSQNAGTSFFFVNRDFIRKIGMPLPPERWDIETFERYGREYIVKANAQGIKKKQPAFLTPNLDRETFRRTLGVSIFNETMTKSAIDVPAHVFAMKKIRDWTVQDHFLPSRADVESISVEAGAGGANGTTLLNQGVYGMMWSGLPILIGLHEIKANFDIGICECPHGGYPNTVTRTYTLALYSAGKNIEYAKYFLYYLTSEPHNLQIADNGDQMPPIPSFRKRDEFMKPFGRTNEWDAHAIYSEKAKELGIANEYSPYAAYNPLKKEEQKAFDSYMAGILTA